MKSILLIIKKLRQKSGLTHAQMAEKIHISLKAWQKVENGLTRLDLDWMQQVAGILGTKLSELIKLDEECLSKAVTKTSLPHCSELPCPLNEITLTEGMDYEKRLEEKNQEIEFYRRMICMLNISIS